MLKGDRLHWSRVKCPLSMSSIRALVFQLLVLALATTTFGELDTTYFRIAEDGVVAVIGYPSNSPPILTAMLNSGLWLEHVIEIKKVDEINVVLYNMEQLAFESSALPAVNKPVVKKNTYLAFDQSKGIARPDVAIGGINEVLESVKMTTDEYMQYIIISQSADFRDARTREFNSVLPFFATAEIPTFSSNPYLTKKFLCLIGSPKAHKLIFGAILHHRGYLRKSIEWSAGSFTGNSAKEVQTEARRRTKHLRAGNIDMDAFNNFASKLPNIIDTDPSLKTQHTELNPELYARGHIHVILESEDLSPDTELCEMQFRYTEKTVKSIFFGYPFLLYGNFGTLKLLQSHGFRTFHPYINETYDLIPFRHLRMLAIIDEIGRINALNGTYFNKLLDDVQKISAFNQKLLHSKSFKEKLRAQGEYALGLTDAKPIDYDDLEDTVESALKSVNAPACETLPPSTGCNPVCGYTIYDQSKVKDMGHGDKDPGKEHQLVFEDAHGKVIEDEKTVTEPNLNTPKPLKDDIIIKPEMSAKEKKDDDTLGGVLSEAAPDEEEAAVEKDADAGKVESLAGNSKHVSGAPSNERDDVGIENRDGDHK